MPKQTFLNLPEKKRQRIINVAIEEFAEYDYNSASISRMVAEAGIAKGSFYQYFEDKKDLYLYLFELVAQEKANFLNQTPPPDIEQGLFPYMHWLFKQGVKFEFANPRLAKLGYHAIYGDAPLYEDVMAQVKGMSTQFFAQLVNRGIEQGDIDPDIDADLAAFVFNAIFLEFGNYLLARLGIAPEMLLQDSKTGIDFTAVQPIFASLMNILEHGMGSKASQ